MVKQLPTDRSGDQKDALQVRCMAHLVIPVAALDCDANEAGEDSGDEWRSEENENAAADEPEGDVERVVIPQILPRHHLRVNAEPDQALPRDFGLMKSVRTGSS